MLIFNILDLFHNFMVQKYAFPLCYGNKPYAVYHYIHAVYPYFQVPLDFAFLCRLFLW